MNSITQQLLIKQQLSQVDNEFIASLDITTARIARVKIVDLLLKTLHAASEILSSTICIAATGGYGAMRLFPNSDIDLLIIITDRNPYVQHKLTLFIDYLWTYSLKLSLSVRTTQEIINDSQQDLSFYTALLDIRYISGNLDIFAHLISKLIKHKPYSTYEFILLKEQELQQRYNKFNDTVYNLEPNLKNSPGCIRDIQTYFVIIQELGKHLVTHVQYKEFIQSTFTIYKIRYILNILSKNNENLLFNYQLDISKILSNELNININDSKQVLIETLMQKYYLAARNVKYNISFIFRFHKQNYYKISNIDYITEDFYLQNNSIHAKDKYIFMQNKYNILNIFLLLIRYKYIQIHYYTLKYLQESSIYIDNNFRNDKENQKQFLTILKAESDVYKTLRLMHDINILDKYIPEFSVITGRMQYDLFHIYTVDEHILNTIKKIDEFYHHTQNNTEDKQFLHAIKIMYEIKNPYILYIAALFHDIAKGYKQDHSKLGAKMVSEFCQKHNISIHDSAIIEWLVKEHLSMSIIAQKQDISDRNTVHKFAQIVSNIERLNYLYILTVADISATNSTLWNSWKSHLLYNLYINTIKILTINSDIANINHNNNINELKYNAFTYLLDRGYTASEVVKLWATFDNNYFYFHDFDDIVLHTTNIIDNNKNTIVIIYNKNSNNLSGTTIVFVYTKDKEKLFPIITISLSNLNLNINAARIITTSDSYALNSYMVLDYKNKLLDIDNINYINMIKENITNNIKYELLLQTKYSVNRQLQYFYFNISIDIKIEKICDKETSIVMKITAPDKRGILATISIAIANLDLNIRNAIIYTAGGKVEDIFWLYCSNELYSNDTAIKILEEKIYNVVCEYCNT